MVKVLCALVLYQQKLYDCASYNSLVKNILCDSIQLFVYDNSKQPMHTQQQFTNGLIHYMSDTTNSGVSTGYNRAAIFARNNGFDKLLLLDQDSYFESSSYVCKCLDLAIQYPSIKLFAPIVVTQKNCPMSPRKIVCKIPVRKDFSPNVTYPLRHVGLINSGLLVDVDAFFNVGGYNEAVFLDYSDYQFIDKFSRMYDEFCLVNCKIFQDFSNEQTDTVAILSRFKLFCSSLANYECHSIMDSLCIKFIILKRCLSLTIRCKSLLFIKAMFK